MVVLWYILLCYLIALPFLLIGIGEYILALSFYVNAIVMAYMSRECIIKNRTGPAFATANIFLILFFYVAPIYQIVEFPGYLLNNYSPSANQMVLANLLILLFMVGYIVIYLRRIRVAHSPLLKTRDEKIQAIFPILVVLAAVMAIWAFQTMLTYGIDPDDDAISAGENIALTVRHKIAFVIPFAVLGLYLSRKGNRRSVIIVAALVILVLLSKNIVLDRRNALGPVYLTILTLFLWRNRIGSREVFLIMGPALLFLFPIASIFINNPMSQWGELANLENAAKEIRSHFIDMHYDAWANLVATIQFVQTEGLQLGRQLLGSLLFFLPREMWVDKPVASGQMLGEYLVLSHGLWFTNISFPFPAEGYVDFGVVGVILYGLGFGYYSQRLDYFVNHGSVVDRTSALYFSFYLLFVMRGSFLPAFAFGVGAYIAINVLPAILSRVGIKSRDAVGPRELTGPVTSWR